MKVVFVCVCATFPCQGGLEAMRTTNIPIKTKHSIQYGEGKGLLKASN